MQMARRREDRHRRNRNRQEQRRRQFRRRQQRLNHLLQLRYHAYLVGKNAILPSDSSDDNTISDDSTDTDSDLE